MRMGPRPLSMPPSNHFSGSSALRYWLMLHLPLSFVEVAGRHCFFRFVFFFKQDTVLPPTVYSLLRYEGAEAVLGRLLAASANPGNFSTGPCTQCLLPNVWIS